MNGRDGADVAEKCAALQIAQRPANNSQSARRRLLAHLGSARPAPSSQVAVSCITGGTENVARRKIPDGTPAVLPWRFYQEPPSTSRQRQQIRQPLDRFLIIIAVQNELLAPGRRREPHAAFDFLPSGFITVVREHRATALGIEPFRQKPLARPGTRWLCKLQLRIEDWEQSSTRYR